MNDINPSPTTPSALPNDPKTPDLIDEVKNPGSDLFSPAKAIGEELKKTLEERPDFYFFSPDETTSNKLDAVYKTETRLWNLGINQADPPESTTGRIVELLSENVLFATMVGHVLSGHPAAMTSYEGFFPIITSQLNQHLKFLDQLVTVSWRDPVPSINLLSTSTCWRQDHNGFSHQSPLLISTLLSRPGRYTCFFPADDVSAVAAYRYALNTKNQVNLLTFNKSDESRWIDSHHASFQLENGGASVFGFASDDFVLDDKNGHFTSDPDLIFTAAGDIATRESLAALKLFKEKHPEKKVRFIGISALSYQKIGTAENPLEQDQFNHLFGTSAPILANFHGYPETLKHILTNYAPGRKIIAHGFEEHGTTTTPEQMLRLNHAHHDDLLASAERLVS